MNSASYDSNVHQDHHSAQHHTPNGHFSHHTNIQPALGNFFLPPASTLPIPEHQQSIQLQLPNISTCVEKTPEISTNSVPITTSGTGGLFGSRQIPLTTPLSKTYYNTAVAGIPPSSQRFYGGVAPTTLTSTSSNSVHQANRLQHQNGNTILITNNFSANQYGNNHPHVAGTSAQMQPRTTSGVVNSGSSGVNTLTGCYHNGNASNIRIITTLPNTLHQQQQHIYNRAKDVEATGHDNIIQLQQFYHTPHQQSAYAQHLPSALPTHFTQRFSAPTSPPTALNFTQDDAQHQFFMSMTNNGNSSVATVNNLSSTPKLISTLTEESAKVVDPVNTSPTLVPSPGATTSSNSTLVLDRINICINNHYSDTSGTNTGIESTATVVTSAITSPDNTYSLATNTPQQPSPIIPAIHHKVLLDPVISGGGSGSLHSDSYVSNNSTLVIDEPDSTTTTPHTPPTTPENSSSPPLPLNLAPTRNTMPSQPISSQIIIGNSLIEAKGNNITSQTTVCKPSKKAFMNKTMSSAAVEVFATITHSIDLLDDEECEYIISDEENATVSERVAKMNEISENSVMEIEDNEVEFSTPEAICTKNTIKCDDVSSPNLILQQHNMAVLHDSSRDVDLKQTKSMSSQSNTPIKLIQTAINETASSVTLLTPPTPTTSSPGSIDSLIADKKVSNSSVSLSEVTFAMGEDVFIRKDDGRQYLGTVIGSSGDSEMSKQQKIQYLIRFDDNSELWCGIEEMRRLGNRGGNGNAQMCVACKRVQEQDVIETCEDCRRGYHRSCTRETTPGSGVWFCLRCSKPMKDRAKIVGKHVCMQLSQNKYKSSDEISKISSSSSQRKTPPDIYEFRVEENEIFTSDDEIPIKHIMEKARKTKVSTQNVNTSCLRQKSVKKHNNKDIILCEKISVLDDENANDANSIIQSGPSKRKDEIKEKDVSPLKTAQCLNSSIKQSTDESEFDCKIEDRVLVSDAVNPNSVSLVYNNVSSIITERSSRKRKEFKLSNSYKEVAAEAAAKRYDSSRVCDSSSDENSSSSRGTSLDVIIPPPKNFLGLNNPFRIITPKKNIPASQMIGTSSGCVQNLLNFNRSGTMIKSSIFNTTALDFSSKLAALKSAGIFPNLSTSNLAKAAGQPRTVRTIKRRLSAKDITIGPNQEVRRRRTRRLSSNVEVISTTTINPIPRNFFPLHAKDLLTTQTHLTTTNTTRVLSTFNKQQSQRQTTSATTASFSAISSSSSSSSSPPGSMSSGVDTQVEIIQQAKPSHGRRLRQRPQKISPANSRRSSISSASTVSSTNSSSNITLAALQQHQQALHKNHNKNANANSMQDLKQSVKEYFGGAVNRIESGEQFCIRAKRQLADGQTQYLIEWGDVATVSLQGQLTQKISPTTTTKFSTATLEYEH